MCVCVPFAALHYHTFIFVQRDSEQIAAQLTVICLESTTHAAQLLALNAYRLTFTADC